MDTFDHFLNAFSADFIAFFTSITSESGINEYVFPVAGSILSIYFLEFGGINSPFI